MYSVEFNKVHALNRSQFVREIYLPLKSRRKPRLKRDRDTGISSKYAMK